ncbi:MAG: hypothetical protein EU530_06605 [Promethearchaeota archaeon]|nr:MAG: hypothetical protein EU530_06605 [Candidatus Lokiarchaeota archaeon]
MNWYIYYTMAEGWKIGFGSIGEIENFEQKGKSYLRKFSELFYYTYKVSQIAKKGHSSEVLAKNLVKAFSDCRRAMKYYILGAIFFIDIDAQTSLESLNRVYNVLIEMTAPNLSTTSGFIQIFLGFVYDELKRDASRERAFLKASTIFPRGSQFHEFSRQQLRGEINFREWITTYMSHYNLNDGHFLNNLIHVADSINESDYKEDFSQSESEISVQKYEKRFLEHHTQQKQKNTHVRRCPHCNYFMIAEGIGEKNCPQCHKAMKFALYCQTCGIWYTVKTSKRYMCPTCGNLMIKKENI